MSFGGSGRSRRNLRPKVVHSVSDSENEELEAEENAPDHKSGIKKVCLKNIYYKTGKWY